jgi:hypothetical protein
MAVRTSGSGSIPSLCDLSTRKPLDVDPTGTFGASISMVQAAFLDEGDEAADSTQWRSIPAPRNGGLPLSRKAQAACLPCLRPSRVHCSRVGQVSSSMPSAAGLAILMPPGCAQSVLVWHHPNAWSPWRYATAYRNFSLIGARGLFWGNSLSKGLIQIDLIYLAPPLSSDSILTARFDRADSWFGSDSRITLVLLILIEETRHSRVNHCKR